jgi:carbamoyltransferase
VGVILAKKQVILGIGGFTTDASACLMINGELSMALEEERFTRVKHQGRWPKIAIVRLLENHGLKESDITHISFSYDPRLRLRKRIPYHLMMLPSKPLISSFIIFDELRFVGEFVTRLRMLRKQSGAKLYYLRHHVAHAASVFLSSPYDEAAIYSVDQRGEWDSTLWARGKDRKVTVLGQTNYPHSLGMFYAGITQYLGFGPFDEYKVMGLASYGKPAYIAAMRKVIFPTVENQFKIDTSYFSYHKTKGLLGGSFFTPKFVAEFGPPRRSDERMTEHYMDLAASAQRAFEECVVHQLNGLYRQIPSENLCMVGGCGLNGVMNGRVYTETPFKHLFLPSVSADNGLSLGGALYIRHQVLGQKRRPPLLRADLGTEYSDSEIRDLLELFKLKYTVCADVVLPTVELLEKGKIVGWFQGRMEFGARALGFRSILANPTLPGMKDTLNKFVKFREDFRPFAPSVTIEAADRYFEVHDPIPFMTVVCKTRREGIQKLPATTHVDNTARVQTVHKESSPLYWRLIHEFGKKTGVPVVLNTSFNVMGEPIVEDPRQAIRCYFSTGMDALVIGSHILVKDEADLPSKVRND